MQTVHSITALRELLAPHRKPALVATMGNLHQGHMALVEKAPQIPPLTLHISSLSGPKSSLR